MRILLVTPAPPRSRKGNRVTALRWARLLRALGHRTRVVERYAGGGWPELMIALHARRSLEAIRDFRRAHPGRPLVVALTGTDLYGDLRQRGPAREALALADRLVVLQPRGVAALPAEHRPRARVILQSVPGPRGAPARRVRTFDIAVVGHLRRVKDPLRAALAARRLPPASRLRVLHAGAALDARLGERARREMAQNPRYRWLGELPRWRARRLIAASRALVISSRMEGGAHVVAEAIVAGVPVIASRIDGNAGMLGDDHPAYFDVGDTAALAALLRRAEEDPRFLANLAARSRRLAPRFRPERERRAWARLIAELSPGGWR